MMDTCPLKIWYSSVPPRIRKWDNYFTPWKRAARCVESLITHRLVVWFCWNLVSWCNVHIWRPLNWKKIYFRSNLRWCTAPKLDIFNRNKSAADCSISLKFGTEVDHLTADTPEKIKGSKVKVTAWQNVLAVKMLKVRNWGWPTLILVKIIPMRGATCDACSRSLDQIEIWQIFNLQSEKKPESVVWSPNCCSLLGNLGQRI